MFPETAEPQWYGSMHTFFYVGVIGLIVLGLLAIFTIVRAIQLRSGQRLIWLMATPILAYCLLMVSATSHEAAVWQGRMTAFNNNVKTQQAAVDADLTDRGFEVVGFSENFYTSVQLRQPPCSKPITLEYATDKHGRKLPGPTQLRLPETAGAKLPQSRLINDPAALLEYATFLCGSPS